MSTNIVEANLVYASGAWTLGIRTVYSPRVIAASGAVTTALASVLTAIGAQLGGTVQGCGLFYIDGKWRLTATTSTLPGATAQNEVFPGDPLQGALTTLLNAINSVTPSNAALSTQLPSDGSTDQIAANSGNN